MLLNVVLFSSRLSTNFSEMEVLHHWCWCLLHLYCDI